MQLLNTDDMRKAGISASNASGTGSADLTHALFNKMVKWGWIDGLGRPLSWRHWNRKV